MTGSGDAQATDVTPAVSVVISTRNRSHLLRRALAGVLAQDVPPGVHYEVIVVDNGSCDSTRLVVEQLMTEMPGRIRYVSEAREGVSYGRNAGVCAALAPIMAFTDDDNVVAQDWVATIIRVMDGCPAAAAVGGKILPDWPAHVPRWLDRQHWSPLAILDYGDERFFTSASDPRCLLTANLAVRRELFERIGGFAPEFRRCQDHEWLVRLWRCGERALYAPELVVRAPVAPERLTKRYHRGWHRQHGYYLAAMRMEELLDGSGRMVAGPSARPRLFGVPPHLFAELFRAFRRTAVSLARGDYALALRRSFHFQYLTAYIRRTMSDRWRRRSAMANPPTQPTSPPPPQTNALTISLPRLVLVHALLALLVGGSLYDIETGREHWPLSPYAMFSTVEREPTLRCLRVMGVTAGTVAHELLLVENALIYPFDQCRLTSAFSRAHSDPQRRAEIRAQLRDTLHRYEARRRAGKHDGPALRAVRLYDMHWMLDANAANVSAPDTRRLVDEVELAAPAPALEGNPTHD